MPCKLTKKKMKKTWKKVKKETKKIRNYNPIRKDKKSVMGYLGKQVGI